MSKALYVCSRAGTPPAETSSREIISRILPDHLSANEPIVTKTDQSLLAIANPISELHHRGTSICLGGMFPPTTDWDQPGAKIPDGSYALFRDDDETAELVTDIVGSRTVWYYKDDDVFVASTSQRAAISVLGRFELNKTAAGWLLSSGTLGPGCAWDTALEPIPPDGRLVLDKESWELDHHRGTCEFTSKSESKPQRRKRFERSLDNTFDSLSLDFSRWRLPVSGGMDSRYLLHRLSKQNPRCVTWGLPDDRNQEYNDAAIAERLTEHYDVEHTFYDLTPCADVETVFERFLVAGEGRIDAISSYLDGFQMWNKMFENGGEGIIRGDEGFGWCPVLTEHDVRRTIGMLTASNWPELSREKLPDDCDQTIPEPLQKRPNESLEAWRDRLYHQFRLPYLLAGLSDLKLPYVEIVNPFLSREIISTVRTLSDSDRTNKQLYRDHVRKKTPTVSEAKYGTGPSGKAYLKRESAVEVMRETVDTDRAREIFSPELIEDVLKAAETQSGTTTTSEELGFKERIRSFLRVNLPQTVENILLTWVIDRTLDPNRLMWRIYITVRMCEILEEDANSSREKQA